MNHLGIWLVPQKKDVEESEDLDTQKKCVRLLIISPFMYCITAEHFVLGLAVKVIARRMFLCIN
jgi:hypothetical protein